MFRTIGILEFLFETFRFSVPSRHYKRTWGNKCWATSVTQEMTFMIDQDEEIASLLLMY